MIFNSDNQNGLSSLAPQVWKMPRNGETFADIIFLFRIPVFNHPQKSPAPDRLPVLQPHFNPMKMKSARCENIFNNLRGSLTAPRVARIVYPCAL
jgi:hypothetical protein